MTWDLRRLSYFRAVAEERHFGRAARRLRIAQPSLSQQIRALERTVGAPLLERSPRGVSLTPAGAVLLDEARALLTQAERGLAAVRAAAGVASPEVRVGLPSGVDAALLRRVKEATTALGTGAVATFHDTTTAAQPDLLRAGELDLGLLREPVDADDLRRLTLVTEPLGVVLHVAHPLATRAELRVADLGGQRLAWFPRETAPGYHDEVLATCRQHGWVPDTWACPSQRHTSFVVQLTTNDNVVALLPEHATRHEPELTWRPLLGSPLWQRISLAWRHDLPAGPALSVVRALSRDTPRSAPAR
ncbi:DNA-binding transcriptional regulator, LysR family [Streptoalloteichus tenebrarius]|uniref:DNA-binding transcriptional regulator, LysR family n=1 Tax=Streptoalloteichus tenebrarius (strain ATCC 17920 / DSM 40477 / JCM 4838 / CBS 697.72 / NBRC 16177 / NCIMB 11028 / NRRL B-12390 / A12253. 1 / ISP 5477) TaxID=1933 RepID=A0ABT1HVL1_STRSD|nr:LysR substrate-binding domain-containing protein [Streptoalloteichus tenebrarius]MCP2259542.1 DNA-binding transcriptional regulator, LysR family [Streptoalloteichus tenebrarius]BFF01375.1 LysR substrate-binding domain-containing protein [Streptoalloteichus tenebrarius]